MKIKIIRSEPVLLNIKSPSSKFSFNKTAIFNVLGVLLFLGLVSAGTIYLNYSKTNITLSPAITTTDTIPDELFGSAGDYFSYSLNFTNQANQLQNYSITYWLNSSLNISSGDALLRILASDNSTVLASSSVVADNRISINLNDIALEEDSSALRYFTVEFYPEAMAGAYNLHYSIDAGSHSFN